MPEDAGTLGVYHLRYLGSSPAKGTDGEEVVVDAVQGIRMSLQTNKRASKRKEATGGTGIDCILVVSSEGIRTIEEATRDVIHNTMCVGLPPRPTVPRWLLAPANARRPALLWSHFSPSLRVYLTTL